MSDKSVPRAWLREFSHLHELHDKDLQAVRQLFELRFELIEKQRLELKTDSQKNLDAALSGAQSDLSNLAATYQVGHNQLTTAIDELKIRMTANESRDVGSGGVKTAIIAWGSLGVSAMLMLLTVTHLWLTH